MNTNENETKITVGSRVRVKALIRHMAGIECRITEVRPDPHGDEYYTDIDGGTWLAADEVELLPEQPDAGKPTAGPLSGRWHHGNGTLACGTLRIAREDFDTDPSPEFRAAVFDQIVSALNDATVSETQASRATPGTENHWSGMRFSQRMDLLTAAIAVFRETGLTPRQLVEENQRLLTVEQSQMVEIDALKLAAGLPSTTLAAELAWMHKMENPESAPTGPDRRWLEMLDWRGIETPCKRCSGSGVRTYGSTAAWRGGIGGQLMTSGICDGCWGSGEANRPWLNLKTIPDVGKLLAENASLKLAAVEYARAAEATTAHDEQMNVALGKLAPKGTILCTILEKIWRAKDVKEASRIAVEASITVAKTGMWAGPTAVEQAAEATTLEVARLKEELAAARRCRPTRGDVAAVEKVRDDALAALRSVTGKEAEGLAHDMDHRNRDHSKWWKAVEKARALLERSGGAK